MENPLLPRRPRGNSTEQLLMAIIGRLDNVSGRLDHVAERIDNLVTVIVQQQQTPPTEEKNEPKKEKITTAVALVVFALTVLATLIIKGCTEL